MLTGDVTLDSEICVQDGCDFRVFSDSDAVRTITRADGYTGAMFTVDSNASLILMDLKLDGQKKTASAPLINTADLENSDAFESLTLDHVTVTGNRGECGISCDGILYVGDQVVVQGNKIQESDASECNLYLRESGWAAVFRALTSQSKIGVTQAGSGYFAGPYRYDWSQADRNCFQADDSNVSLIYSNASTGRNLLFYSIPAAGSPDGNSLSTTYQPQPLSESGGQTITLHNTTASALRVTVLAACYDADGKLLSIRELDPETISAGASGNITVPAPTAGAESGTLMMLDTANRPICAAVRYR
jgi:hypothetical protein